MSAIYFITNTNGDDIFTIQPGAVDITHTDLRLYGMGAVLYGEGVDENLLRLTENFAISQKDSFDADYAALLEPKSSLSFRSSGTGIGPLVGTGNGINNPRLGQTWFNTTDNVLYVYDGSGWSTPAGLAGFLKRDGSLPMSGNLDMAGFSILNLNVSPPSNPSDVATKAYVDSEIAALDSSAITNVSSVTGSTVTLALNQLDSDITTLSTNVNNNFLQKAGGTMTGFLTLNSNPTNNLHAATKNYVDINFLRSNTTATKTSGSLIFNENIAATFGGAADFVATGIDLFSNFNNGGTWHIRHGLNERFTLNTFNGNFTATGDVTGFSDSRVKANVQVIPDALDRVSQISGVTFSRLDLDDNNARHTGVIAQDVQAVLPEAVHENKDGMLSVAYGNMVGLLIEAIKDLKEEVDSLKMMK